MYEGQQRQKWRMPWFSKGLFLSIQTFMLYLDLKCRHSQDKAIRGFNSIETISILK